MFRAAIDQLMNDKVAPLLMALAFGGAPPWAMTRRDIKPALVVNLIVAAAVLAYQFPLQGTAVLQDSALLRLVAFEIVTALTSMGALCGLRIPNWIVWLTFAINFLLIAALAAFLLTFKMRLF